MISFFKKGVCIILTLGFCGSLVSGYVPNVDEGNTIESIREIEIDNNSFDYQSLLNIFDDYSIRTTEDVFSFHGENKISQNFSRKINYVNVTDVENNFDTLDYKMNYDVSYDFKTGILKSCSGTLFGDASTDLINATGFFVSNDQDVTDIKILYNGETFLASDIIGNLDQGCVEECSSFTPGKGIARKSLATIIDITITAISIVCAVVSAAVTAYTFAKISRGLFRNILRKSAKDALVKLIKGPLKYFLVSFCTAVFSFVNDILGILFDFSIGGFIAYLIDYVDGNRLNGICFG